MAKLRILLFTTLFISKATLGMEDYLYNQFEGLNLSSSSQSQLISMVETYSSSKTNLQWSSDHYEQLALCWDQLKEKYPSVIPQIDLLMLYNLFGNSFIQEVESSPKRFIECYDALSTHHSSSMTLDHWEMAFGILISAIPKLGHENISMIDYHRFLQCSGALLDQNSNLEDFLEISLGVLSIFSITETFKDHSLQTYQFFDRVWNKLSFGKQPNQISIKYWRMFFTIFNQIGFPKLAAAGINQQSLYQKLHDFWTIMRNPDLEMVHKFLTQFIHIGYYSRGDKDVIKDIKSSLEKYQILNSNSEQRLDAEVTVNQFLFTVARDVASKVTAAKNLTESLENYFNSTHEEIDNDYYNMAMRTYYYLSCHENNPNLKEAYQTAMDRVIERYKTKPLIFVQGDEMNLISSEILEESLTETVTKKKKKSNKNKSALKELDEADSDVEGEVPFLGQEYSLGTVPEILVQEENNEAINVISIEEEDIPLDDIPQTKESSLSKKALKKLNKTKRDQAAVTNVKQSSGEINQPTNYIPMTPELIEKIHLYQQGEVDLEKRLDKILDSMETEKKEWKIKSHLTFIEKVLKIYFQYHSAHGSHEGIWTTDMRERFQAFVTDIKRALRSELHK